MFGLMGVARMSGQQRAFSPLSLFAASEQGAWYDPGGFASMFQDSAGTTPVTAVEQPVGRINDKSGNGNHATQATAAARPVVSARKNWFTSTEDFTDAAWAASSVTKTASTLTFTTAVGYIQYGFPPIPGIVAGATVTLSITMSADTPQPVLLSIADNADGDPFYSLSVNVTTTPTRFTFTQTIGAAFSGNLTVLISGNNVITPGTVVTATDPQIETGSTATRYQRVTTASDYDTVGFPHYISHDGIDDELSTTFPDLGTDVTIARAVPTVGASILTGQTIGAGTWTDSTNHAGLVIIDRALTAGETAALTAYLNAKAGV